MVAKTYQNYPQLGEPYLVNKRMYVDVKTPKGDVKTVRWYTEKEYNKMYAASPVNVATNETKGTQKDALGFQKGYITIFKGNVDLNQDWFETSIARYCRHWGWYIVSTESVPTDLPSGVAAVHLSWEDVGLPTGNLKPDAQVQEAVNALIYDANPSEYQGAIGERLDLKLTIIHSSKKETQYGLTTTHIMSDAEQNIYLWATTAKSWDVGEEHHIRGTVKEFRMFKNMKTTILTRCTEVK